MALRKIDVIPVVTLNCLLKMSDLTWSQPVNGSRFWEPPDSRMVTLQSSPSWPQKLDVLEADVSSWKQQLGSLKSCLASETQWETLFMSRCPKIGDLESLFKFFSYQVVEGTGRYIKPDYRSRVTGSDSRTSQS